MKVIVHMIRFVILLLISVATVRGAVGDEAAEAAAGVAATNSTTCRLNLEGFGSRPGLKAANISCAGGSITATVHDDFIKAAGKRIRNVQLIKGACGPTKGCLLTVCGKSNPVFVNASITALTATPGWWIAVCVQGQSRVAFHRGNFSFNSMVTVMRVRDTGTSVLLNNCTVRNNTAIDTSGNNSVEALNGWRLFDEAESFDDKRPESYFPDKVFNTGVLVEDAHLHVQACTISHNAALLNESNGEGWGALEGEKFFRVSGIGALTGMGTAMINIHHSLLMRNTAARGGAVFLADKAQLRVQGCHFKQNTAAKWGGAVYATGQSGIVVVPGRQNAGELFAG